MTNKRYRKNSATSDISDRLDIMKIAFIVDSFPKLSETFILNQVTGLLDLGHDVQIFPTWHTSESKVHPDVTRYDLLARTHPIPPELSNRYMRLVAAGIIFIVGFFTHPIRTFRLLRLVISEPQSFSLRHLYFLSRFLDGFDVIHCHYGYNGLLAVKLRRLGIKGLIGTVFHGHDMYIDKPHTYRTLFTHADVLLPISDRWRSMLLELGCPPDKAIVHHMGVNLASFPFKRRTIAPGQKIRVLIVARLVPIKGHEFLFRAFAAVTSTRPHLSLIVAGGGPLQHTLEELAQSLGIANRTEFLGDVGQDEVRAIIESSHILVQPSITTPDSAQEGIPMVLMEAMAAGIPVMSTQYSCIPELVIHGQSGFLVPERDVAAIAEKLAYLIDNPDSWVALGTAGHEQVARSFYIQTLNLTLQQIYMNLLGR